MYILIAKHIIYVTIQAVHIAKHVQLYYIDSYHLAVAT